MRCCILLFIGICLHQVNTETIFAGVTLTAENEFTQFKARGIEVVFNRVHWSRHGTTRQ